MFMEGCLSKRGDAGQACPLSFGGGDMVTSWVTRRYRPKSASVLGSSFVYNRRVWPARKAQLQPNDIPEIASGKHSLLGTLPLKVSQTAFPQYLDFVHPGFGGFLRMLIDWSRCRSPNLAFAPGVEVAVLPDLFGGQGGHLQGSKNGIEPALEN